MIDKTFEVLTHAMDNAVLAIGEARTRAEYLMREGEEASAEHVLTYAAGLLGSLHEMQIRLMDEHRAIVQLLVEHDKENAVT